MDAVRWAIVVAAIFHVVEELQGGWLDWAQRYVPGITLNQFLTINTAFVSLCILGALVGSEYPVFSLSIASLIFSNALIHIIPALRLGCYTPGLISAVLLYLPLSVTAYYLALHSQQMSVCNGVLAGLLGFGWMSVPFIFQGLRLSRARYCGK
jgi:hypothetical protein